MALTETTADSKILEDISNNISNSRFENWNLGELAIELIRVNQLAYLGRIYHLEDYKSKSRIQITSSDLGDITLEPTIYFYKYNVTQYIALPYYIVIKNNQILFFAKVVNGRDCIREDYKPRGPTHYEIQDMRAMIIYEISKYHEKIEKIEPIGDKDFTMHVESSKIVVTTDNTTAITTANNSLQSTISSIFF